MKHGKLKTNEQFKNDLFKLYGDNIELLSDYTGNRKEVYIHFKDCNHYFYQQPQVLLRGNGCKICNNNISKQSCLRLHDDVKREIEEKYNGRLIVTGQYTKSREPIEIFWTDCNHYNYKKTPNKLLTKECGCSVCSGKEIIIGINDINTTNPKIAELFVNEEDKYKYTQHSGKKVLMRCPDCGYEEERNICNTVLYNKFPCKRCGDGISYPNKFIRGMLSQIQEIQNSLKYEYAIGKYRFDNYFEFKNNKYIIEVDGLQHTYPDQIENDKNKEQILKENNVKLIRINAHISDKKYIMNSVLKSEINDMFDLSKINWELCDKYGTRNIEKDVCLYYESYKTEKTIKEISDSFKLCTATINKYIKHGEQLGWCTLLDSNKKKELEQKHKKDRSKPVKIDTGFVFKSRKLAGKLNNTTNKNIITGIKRKQKTNGHYYYDVTEEEILDAKNNNMYIENEEQYYTVVPNDAW